MPSLFIGSTARLDLAGSSAWVVDYTGTSPLTDLEALLTSGRNGGDWLGTGITSSRAATDTRFAVAMTEASALDATMFPGTTVAVDATSVLFRVTYKGDSSLDGDVDFDDLLKLAQNYGASGQTWITGDTDYNGTINFDDLLALAQNYGNTLNLGEAVNVFGDFEHDRRLALSLVPEPTTFVSVVGALALVRRRRD